MTAQARSSAYALIVGSVIAQLRERRRWTQGDLAARVGLTQSTVSRIERGQAQPQPYELHAIASAFGMTTPQLSGLVDRAYQHATTTAETTVGAQGEGDGWKIALGVLGFLGVAGLAAFAVAAALAEDEKPTPTRTSPKRRRT